MLLRSSQKKYELYAAAFLAATALSGCSLSYNLHDRYTFDLVDAGTDAGPEADSGQRDAGPRDAGALPEPARALFPWNGYTTGSALVSEGSPVVDHPRKPKLMWHPSAGASRYEVQMEADCPLPGFRACTFPNPELTEETTETTFRPSEFLEVSMTPPVGRRYYWRVRACNDAGCGEWSEIRYLDVGRLAQDFNGDGYGDVAVGAPFQQGPRAQNGTVNIYYGSAAGVSPDPDLILSSPIEQDYAAFGYSVSGRGDMDGDGFSDLAVGANAADNPELDEGTVFLYRGSATGLVRSPTVTFDNPTGELVANFGNSVAIVPDIDGDGFADLVVGSPGQSSPESREGNVFIYRGDRIVISDTPSYLIDNPANQIQGHFGETLSSAGDTNGVSVQPPTRPEPGAARAAWRRASWR